MSEKLKLRVARKVREAADVFSFQLVDPDGGPLQAFTAGSHVDVHLRDGITRQYSLCSDPATTDSYEIAVALAQDSRGGSRAMCEGLREGDSLEISRPRNHFALHEPAERSLLLAGGIGITPLLSMCSRLAALGRAFELDYFTRSVEATAFRTRIEASGFAGAARFHAGLSVDEACDTLNTRIASISPGTHVYVCGPAAFMEHVQAAATLRGIPADHVHCEYFSNANSGSQESAGFELQLARTGRVVSVAPTQSAVQALRGAGVELETSCEEGVCGTCLVRVLDGTPLHRDAYLTEAERARNDQFLPCVSRACTARLVIDL